MWCDLGHFLWMKLQNTDPLFSCYRSQIKYENDIYSIKSHLRGGPRKPPFEIVPPTFLKASYAHGTEIGVGLSKTVFRIKSCKIHVSIQAVLLLLTKDHFVSCSFSLPRSLAVLLDRSIPSRAVSLSLGEMSQQPGSLIHECAQSARCCGGPRGCILSEHRYTSSCEHTNVIAQTISCNGIRLN